MSSSQGEIFHKCISLHLSLLSTDLPGEVPGFTPSGYFWVVRPGLIADVIVIPPPRFHAHLTWLRRSERHGSVVGLVPATRHWAGPTVTALELAYTLICDASPSQSGLMPPSVPLGLTAQPMLQTNMSTPHPEGSLLGVCRMHR